MAGRFNAVVYRQAADNMQIQPGITPPTMSASFLWALAFSPSRSGWKLLKETGRVTRSANSAQSTVRYFVYRELLTTMHSSHHALGERNQPHLRSKDTRGGLVCGLAGG
ncbi:unnamed protein product [Clonostachys solani]|uniref:Uncharacterized protein n=1 Tax=Clonostachys solani TaxID=160281 RepID=A0A9N9W219_9HYPO|nr:unnamed protein product [Clonostachys solani]